jgi:aspartyl aminopeptidase
MYTIKHIYIFFKEGYMVQKNKDTNEVKTFKPSTAWDRLTPKDLKLLDKRCGDYLNFISQCKTERATVEYIKEKAVKAGFKPLPKLGKGKKLKPGTKVMFVNNNKAICLGIIGKKPAEDGLRLIAAHLDVPKIDVKSLPLYEKDNVALFKTHYYGGIKKFQWVTIPLSLHIFAIDKSGKTHSFVIGEKPGDPVFTISDLAIHLAQKMQMKRLTNEAVTGEELNVLVGSKPDPKTDKEKPNRVRNMVLREIEKQFGLTEEDLAWAEMHVVPAFKAAEVGFDRGLIGAYGHDDRSCVYAAFAALSEIDVPEHTAATIFLDKEEVGSAGPNGAQSGLIMDIISMLTEATSGETSYATVRNVTTNTLVFSADTSASIDPNYEGAYDPLNSGYLGKGIWISKFSGKGGKSGSLEVDIEFLAKIRKMLADENIPYQFGEMGKVDEGGGGTVARLIANNNIQVVDIAIPTVSLHSPFEIISKVDYHYSVSAYKAFMKNHY